MRVFCPSELESGDVGFCEGIKAEIPGKKPSERGENKQQIQPSRGYWPKSNSGNICERRALSKLRHPFSRPKAAKGTSRSLNFVHILFSKANYNDRDGGILFGRWTETYPKNCTPPTAWTGSTAILEKFWKKKFYVKYGQCWVFSGLVTTCK